MSQNTRILQALGSKIITSINGVLKALELYDSTNATVTKLLQQIVQLVNSHGENSGESVRLQTDGENFFLNQELLRLDKQGFERAMKLNSVMARLKGNEFEFRPGIEVEDVRAFFTLLTDAQGDRSLIPELEDGGGTGISLRYVEGTLRQGRDSMEVRSEAGARYFVTLQILTAEYLAFRKQQKRTSIMAIRRTLQRLIDLIQSHRDSIVALLHHGRYDAGLEGHISRTSMLAGCIANAMGLDRRSINAVCLQTFPALAPLAHLDERWSSPSSHQKEDLYKRMMNAPGRSLSAGAGVVRDLVAHYEYSGLLQEGESPYSKDLPCSLAGRIVAVAALYDAIRGDLEEGDRCRPVAAKGVLMTLDEMMRGNRLPPTVDKDVVGVLLHMMGSLPPGSVVRLENGACGIVRQRPYIIQLTDTFGRYLERPRMTHAKRGTPLNPPLGLDMGPPLAYSDGGES